MENTDEKYEIIRNGQSSTGKSPISRFLFWKFFWTFATEKRWQNGQVREVSPLTPRPKLNGRQAFKHDSVAGGWNKKLICWRASNYKCEPLLRFG